MAPNTGAFDLSLLAEQACSDVKFAQENPNSRLDEECFAHNEPQAGCSTDGKFVDDVHNRDLEEGNEEKRASRVAFVWDHHVDIENSEANEESHQTDDIDRTLSSDRVRRFIRSKSSLLDDNHEEVGVDEERLAKAVSDAGNYSHGIIGIEVWELDQDDGLLKNPKGGWWRHPYLEESEELKCLEDEINPQSASVHPCMPGVGLPGTLWFESRGVRRMRRSSSVGRSFTNLASIIHAEEALGLGAVSPRSSTGALGREHQDNVAIRWRDVKTLLMDPDTAKDQRLSLRLNAGFGLAAGIPFDTGGCKGIVIFLAREKADQGRLLSMENQAYMLRASELIGAVIASIDARRACVVYKQVICKDAYQKVRKSMCSRSSSIIKQRKRCAEAPLAERLKDPPAWARIKRTVTQRVGAWAKKCLGGDLQAPPGMTFRQAAWTWVGCFVGLLILSTMNEYAQDLSNNELLLLIGPFGALMTLQYGLTAAPASQPRNVILGQAVAGAISMAFTYVPESMLSTWMRRAVGPAFSISAMLKLGIPHPPAGAHSVIYASGHYGWMFYFLVVFASIISVIPATLVNNASEKRQYPTYWVKKHKLSFSPPNLWHREGNYTADL